jgi:phosphatidylglycerophosphate synthase
MSAYQPTSRRPIADVFRTTADIAVRWCVRWNVHPDTVSYLSIVASAAAACCFWQVSRQPVLLLLLGPAFCYMRLWLNMLDGMVALASGKASPHGEIVNDMPDRISDVLIFVGVAYSGLASRDLAYLCAVFALLTAYVGVLGQAVGARRQFGGVMSKPWRMVALHAGAWATWVHPRTLDVALALIVLGCVQTVWVRLAAMRLELAAKTEKG